MMYLIKQLLVNIADQMLATFILGTIIYIFVRGIQAITTEPPTWQFFAILMGIGVFLGGMATLRYVYDKNPR